MVMAAAEGQQALRVAPAALAGGEAKELLVPLGAQALLEIQGQLEQALIMVQQVQLETLAVQAVRVAQERELILVMLALMVLQATLAQQAQEPLEATQEVPVQLVT